MSAKVSSEAVTSFAKRFRGSVITPDSATYDAVRRAWNGRFDRRPELIVRCLGAGDVVAALALAREHRLAVAVRGGGHSYAGFSTTEGGLLVDLSLMKAVEVNPSKRTVRVQPGATWGDLNREAEAFGLAMPGGVISTVGVAGATLGGGVGRISRKFGLAIDNLIAAEVVLADGTFVDADEDTNSDLFWALRGGGGNFGLVTSFHFKLHPLGPLLAGPIVYALEDAPEVMKFLREWLPTTPDELSALVNCSASGSGNRLLLAITVCYAGDHEVGNRVLEPLRAFKRPLADRVTSMRYSHLQSLYDTGAPYGIHMSGGSHYLDELTDGALEVILRYARQVTSPLSQLLVSNTLSGAAARVPDDAMAFSHRKGATYWVDALAMWHGGDPDAERHERWAKDFWNELRPFASGAAYINYMHDEGEDRIRAAYGPEKYSRLVELKNKYDPSNLFRSNQNIAPTVSPGAEE